MRCNCCGAALFYGGYTLSRSRTYQLAGDIVSRIDTDKKVVALTFDDGPTAYTPEILAMLDECGIHATFFLTGREIEENIALARDIAQAGHQIGNHSYSHQRMVLRSRAFIDDEIDTTNTLIRDAGYVGDICFRAPYCKKLLLLPLALSKRDMVSVTWDIEPDYTKTLHRVRSVSQTMWQTTPHPDRSSCCTLCMRAAKMPGTPYR